MDHYLAVAREMLFSRDVTLAVVGAMASTFIIYICTVVLHFRLPNLANLLFWKQFAEGLVIAVSEVKVSIEPQMRAGDEADTRLYFPSEVVATNKLLDFLRGGCRQEPQITSSSADFDTMRDRNILIVGGSRYNEVARRFMQEIKGELFYVPRRLLGNAAKLAEHELRFFIGRDASYPDFTYSFQEEAQPATVILRKDLYAEGQTVLLVAGISQESTLAGVTWVLSRPACFWMRVRRYRKGFQAIIRCRVISQYKVSNIREIFYQELS